MSKEQNHDQEREKLALIRQRVMSKAQPLSDLSKGMMEEDIDFQYMFLGKVSLEDGKMGNHVFKSAANLSNIMDMVEALPDHIVQRGEASHEDGAIVDCLCMIGAFEKAKKKAEHLLLKQVIGHDIEGMIAKVINIGDIDNMDPEMVKAIDELKSFIHKKDKED